MDVANLGHKDAIPEFYMNKINMTRVSMTIHVSNWYCIDVFMQGSEYDNFY